MWITLEDNCRKAPIVRKNGGWPQPPELWITEKAGGECEQKKKQKIRKTGGKDWLPLWVHRLRPAACRAATLADAPDVCRRTLEEKGKRNGAKRVREERRKRAFRHCAAEDCCAVLGKGGRRRVWATCSGIGLAERGEYAGKKVYYGGQTQGLSDGVGRIFS